MFAHLSKLLSLRQRQSCSAALNELYCHLSVDLMRQNAQALLVKLTKNLSVTLCFYALFCIVCESLYLNYKKKFNSLKLN